MILFILDMRSYAMLYILFVNNVMYNMMYGALSDLRGYKEMLIALSVCMLHQIPTFITQRRKLELKEVTAYGKPNR